MHLLIDMDDVLADTEQGFTEQLRKLYPNIIPIPLEQRSSFNFEDQYPPESVQAITSAAGYFLGLPPVPGAVEALHTLAALGHEVSICTAPLLSNQSCASEKLLWVKEHLGSEWVTRVVISCDKTVVRGDILLDDKPKLEGLLEPTWEHVIFTRPWNLHITDKRRIANWSEWQSIVKVTTFPLLINKSGEW